MPANTQPIFPLTPRVSWTHTNIANTATDGTGEIYVAFVAGENGSRIDQIKVKSLGYQNQNVLRFFVNNGSTNSIFTNNSLVHELTIPQITASSNSATDEFIVTDTVGAETRPAILYLPPRYRIFCTIALSLSSTIQVTVFGGDY